MNSKNKKPVTPIELEPIDQTGTSETYTAQTNQRTDGQVRVNGGEKSGDPANTEVAERVATAEAGGESFEALVSERDKLKEQLLRTAADFDNFRKRSRRDVEDAKRRGKEETIRDLLPVFDSFERAIAAAKEASDVKSIVEGVSMVLKLFEDTGDRMDLKRLATVGERFDPSVHDAIQEIESADMAPGTVIAEVLPGYRLGEHLLRAAVVVVARAPKMAARGSTGEKSEEGAA